MVFSTYNLPRVIDLAALVVLTGRLSLSIRSFL
jgi:hypothetical protein